MKFGNTVVQKSSCSLIASVSSVSTFLGSINAHICCFLKEKKSVGVYVCTYIRVYVHLYVLTCFQKVYMQFHSLSVDFLPSTTLRDSAVLLNIFNFHYYIFTESKH